MFKTICKNYGKVCLVGMLMVIAISLWSPLVGAYEDVLVDFNVLGNEANLPTEQDKILHNDKWKVTLNQSADYIVSRKLSYAKNVLAGQSTDNNIIITKGAQNYVIGVRANFPKNKYSAYAVLRPFFEINPYVNQEAIGKGFIKNIRAIKSIKTYVRGRNFPHLMFVSLKDHENKITQYQLGYLNYAGWRELVWNNDAYIENIRFKSFVNPPLYQVTDPMVKINDISFYRQGTEIAGDFIVYISWIKIEYDKAFIKTEEDIDDEAIWEIQKTLFLEKQAQENKRLNRNSELQQLELQKMNQQNNAGGGAQQQAPPPAAPAGN